MNAHMERFRSNEPLFNLPAIIGNPSLVLRLFAMLNSIALSSGPQGSDVRCLSDGTYVLNPAFVISAHYGCSRLALIIISAAYGINTNVFTSGIPITIPLVSLRQVALPMPSILFLLGYPDNSWIQERFETHEAALLQGHAYCTFARMGMAWLLECLRRSIICGERTLWQFGAVLGMPEREFLAQARDFSASRGPEMRYTQAIDFMVYPALDFEMARLIRPDLTHIAIYRDRFTCGLAVLPFRVQNQEGTVQVGPMDELIARIFRMECATIIFIHDDSGAHNSVLADHDQNTLSLSNSANSSRSSSVQPGSSSSDDGSSSSSSDEVMFLY